MSNFRLKATHAPVKDYYQACASQSVAFDYAPPAHNGFMEERRSVKDFRHFDVQVFNPFEYSSGETR